MATTIEPETLEELLKASEVMDTYDFRDDEDEDDYIVARLYKAPDGRHFRYVESSGMNSAPSGAGNFGEWLAEDERVTWTQW